MCHKATVYTPSPCHTTHHLHITLYTLSPSHCTYYSRPLVHTHCQRHTVHILSSSHCTPSHITITQSLSHYTHTLSLVHIIHITWHTLHTLSPSHRLLFHLHTLSPSQTSHPCHLQSLLPSLLAHALPSFNLTSLSPLPIHNRFQILTYTVWSPPHPACFL